MIWRWAQYLIFLCLTSTFIYIFYALRGDSMDMQANVGSDHGKVPLIVGYTTWFDSPMFGKALETIGACSAEVQCKFTDDRSLLSIADAVVIHPRDIELQDLPIRHHSHQSIWMITSESPYNMRYKDAKPLSDTPQHYYNASLSYRHDSTCWRGYGRYEKRQVPLEDNGFNIEQPDNRAMVVWLNSQCATKSRRENVANLLKLNGIDVIIWGHCGDENACPKSQKAHCNKRIAEFKFYLAFENSLCDEYVTEKIFERLEVNSVPIVLQRKAMQYTGLPGSAFIAVDDFARVSALATKLKQLSDNYTEYKQFFEYRKYYQKITHSTTGFCCMCKLLNSKTNLRSYENISHWFSVETNCETKIWK